MGWPRTLATATFGGNPNPQKHSLFGPNVTKAFNDFFIVVVGRIVQIRQTLG
jgi:hypothetical protein